MSLLLAGGQDRILELMGVHIKRFKILVSNVYANTQFKVSYSKEVRKTNSDVERLIKITWKKKEEEAQRQQALLYSAKLCRLIGFKTDKNTFELTLGETTYKELLGTNVHYPWIYSKYGNEYLSNALGVSAVIVTSDGNLLFGQRASYLAYDAGRYDVCGGFIDPDKDSQDGIPDPFKAMKRRVMETFLIKEEQIEYIYSLGLMQNYVTLKPELTFEVKLKLSSQEVKFVPPQNIQVERMGEYVTVEDSPNELRKFLIKRRNQITFVCQACIWMFAMRKKYWSSFESIHHYPFIHRKLPKIALVLGGGFAKGFAHIGVIKVLEEMGLKLDLIVGNSIGGLVAASYASNMSYEICEQTAVNFHWKMIADWEIPKKGLLKGEKLEEYVRTIVTYDKFSDLQIPLAVVTTDLVTGEEVILCDEKVAKSKKIYDRANPFFVFGMEIATNLAYDYRIIYMETSVPVAVRATCSFPGIFNPVQIGERLLADGIISDNIPVKIARRLGAEFIIAVDLSFERKSHELNNIFDIIMRGHTLQSDKLARYQLKGADIIIRPDMSGFRFNDFSHAQEMIKTGEEATRSLSSLIQRRLIKKAKISLRKER